MVYYYITDDGDGESHDQDARHGTHSPDKHAWGKKGFLKIFLLYIYPLPRYVLGTMSP